MIVLGTQEVGAPIVQVSAAAVCTANITIEHSIITSNPTVCYNTSSVLSVVNEIAFVLTVLVSPCRHYRYHRYRTITWLR